MEKIYCETCKWLVIKESQEGMQKACTNESKSKLVEDWYSSRKMWSDPAVNNGNNDCKVFEARSTIEINAPVEG